LGLYRQGVSGTPLTLRREILGLIDAIKDVRIAPFVPDGAIAALESPISARLEGRRAPNAVADANGARRLRHSMPRAARHRKINLDAQPVAVEATRCVEQPEPEAIAKATGPEGPPPALGVRLGKARRLRRVFWIGTSNALRSTPGRPWDSAPLNTRVADVAATPCRPAPRRREEPPKHPVQAAFPSHHASKASRAAPSSVNPCLRSPSPARCRRSASRSTNSGTSK
jgi:hypothetical protein